MARPRPGRRAQICAISPYVPVATPRHAGGAYFVRHALEVGRRHDYTVLVPATEQNQREVVDVPPELDVRLFEVPPARTNPWSPWSRRLRFGLLPTEPGPAPGSEAAALVARSDLVEIHWARSALNLVPSMRSRSRRVPIVAIPHDVASQLIARRLAPTRRNALKLRYTRSRERSLYDRCQRVLVFSEKDRILLQQIGVRSPVSVVDPPLDTPDDLPDRREARPTALFMGAMYRPVNRDAAVWFVRNVWPHVLERVPEARFVVVGADPPSEVVALASATVDVAGWRADLDPYFRDATVFVAPLLYGAGLKFKVPQAMLYGLPVVATAVAAEGIVELSGPDVFGAVTDDAGAMADAVVRLLTDRAAAARIGGAARTWAAAEYAFERRLGEALDCYDDLIA